MRVQLLWFPGCPNVEEARRNLRRALAACDLDVPVEEVDLTAPARSTRSHRRSRPLIATIAGSAGVVAGRLLGSVRPVLYVLAALAAVAASGAGASEEDAGVTTLEFSVLGMTCAVCAESATRVLEQTLPDAREVRVDFATKKGLVTALAPVTKDEIRKALATLGFEARFPGDPAASPPLSAEERAALDIRTLSGEQEVDVREHLAPGKYTVFDYHADWCGPCRLLTPKLERLVQADQRVALRTVNIGSWKSPAAKQATRDFRLPALPYVRVYGPDGELLSAVHGNHIEKIEALIGADRGEP
jgi:thioredoxin 1